MGPSKADLRDQTSRVTLELRNLQDKMDQYRSFFKQLEARRQEVRRSHFPPKYFLMKDMVREQSRLATDLVTMEQKESTDTGQGHKKKGTISSLLEKSMNFLAETEVVYKLETIKDELKELKKSELKEELQKTTDKLEKTKADHQKAHDLLKRLASLYHDFKHDWPWSRYRNLLHGVKDILRSFNKIVSDEPS